MTYVIRYILYYFVLFCSECIDTFLIQGILSISTLTPLLFNFKNLGYFFIFVHKMVQFFQVKVVAKKNMRVLTYADLNLPAGSSLPDAAPSAPSSITREVRLER